MTKCLTSSCKWRVPGECAYYSGDFISGYEITDGDNFNTVVQKITSYASTGGGGSSETSNSSTNTNSAIITLSGASNRNIQVDVKRDPQSNNKLTIGVAGLYVAPASFSSTYNSGTGVLGITVDGQTVSHTISGSGVASIFGRTGVVVAEAGDYNWADIGSKPTTIAEFGITDPIVFTNGSYANPTWITSLDKAKVGLGNVANVDTTDAANISSGTLNSARIGSDIARINSPALTGAPTAPTAISATNNTQIATTAFVHSVVAAVSSGVTSFNGRSGVVVPVSGDYTWAQINKATSSLADIATRSAGDINSGTLADGRLSTNVPLLNINNTFTGTITFTTLASGASSVVRASTAGLLSTQTIASFKTDLALVKADVGLGNVDNTSDATKNSAVATLTNKSISGANNTLSNIPQSAITSLTSDLALKANAANAALTGTPTAPTAAPGTNTTQIATTEFVLANSGTTNASSLTSGTLADARLSTNVPLKNGANIFSALQTIELSTEQLRIGFDASNYMTFTVGSNGATSIGLSTGQSISFSNTVITNNFQTNASATSANFAAFSNTAVSSSTSQLQIEGSSNISARVIERGSAAPTVPSGNSYFSHIIGTHTVVEAGSSSHNILGQFAVKALSVVNGGGATNYLSTMYVEGAPTGVTAVSGTYALWVAAGDIRLGSLAGTGNRMVVANADGVLSTQAIPSGGGSYPVQTVMLSADETSSATPDTWSSITGLTFPVVAGESYRFEAYIIFSVDSTSTGTTWAITGPASPTILNYHALHASGAGFNTFWPNEVMVTYDDGISSNATPATSGNSARIIGFIRPSASGNITFRMRAEAASGTTAKIGSYAILQRLA